MDILILWTFILNSKNYQIFFNVMPKIKIIIKIIIINNNKYINTEPILSYKNKDCTTEFLFFFHIFFHIVESKQSWAMHHGTQKCGSRYQDPAYTQNSSMDKYMWRVKTRGVSSEFFLQVNYNRIKYIIFFYIIFQIQIF